MDTFRILSQTVQISNLDFEKSSFNVTTEIAIIALRSDLTEVALNLGRDCILPNEEQFQGDGDVSINGIKSKYTRKNFKLRFPEENDWSILTLKKAFVEAENEFNDGELIVEIPEDCLNCIENQKVLTLHIDIIVLNPKEGIKFCYDAIPSNSNDAENNKNEFAGAHIFTYRSNPLSSTKEWLPCVEQPDQLCVWRFEVSIPKQLTAICCGDLIDTTTENEQKTFHYQLLVPTSAANIGFAIGDFQMYVQPEMPEIISFVIPELMPLLRHTMSTLNRIFVFFEEFLSCRFPYGTYWQVFVNQTPDELTTFAGLSIFSFKVLYHKKILDLVQSSRQILAKGVAQQFFGSFINSINFNEIWLIRAISSYCTGIYVDRSFGTCEYFYQLRHILNDSCDYESRFGGIKLRNKLDGKNTANHFHFNQFDPKSFSPLYLDALAKKGHFLMRMLEKRLPKEQFTKVLQRILSIGMQNSQNINRPIEWNQLLISIQTFMRIVTDVSGQEFPSFIDQWIDTGGHVKFHVSHTFNRKRNIIEVELRQTYPPPIGCQIYAGPLTVVVQEIDGHFVHTLQVDAAISKHDIPCHSKGRKLKKKKVMLGTGEEVEMDLAQMDDSPILWIRIDPELLLYRQLTINQPFYQWELLLLHERDILAQQMAIEALHNIPRHQTRTILEETVRNEKLFYRIRRDAAFSLVHVYNSLPESQTGDSPPLIEIFQKQFCCKTCPDIPQPNNYVATSSNLQNYFLLQVFPSAIGSIRGQAGKICPDYVVHFLLGLVQLNDNSNNRYSDDNYRAALIHALGKTLTIADRQSEHPEEMEKQAKNILEEVTHSLNMDTMKPSFGKVVSQQCLQVLYELQRCLHIPQDTEIFWKFGQSKNVYAPLRLSALFCIVAMIRRSRMPEFVRTLLRLIEVVLNDPDPFVRYSLANRLCTHPPFECTENAAIYPMNTKRLAFYIWSAISNPKTETRLRSYLADLYFILYGNGSPTNFSNY